MELSTLVLENYPQGLNLHEMMPFANIGNLLCTEIFHDFYQRAQGGPFHLW